MLRCAGYVIFFTRFTSVRLSIFSRLTLSFLAIFLIMGVVNAYTVWKLRDVNKETAQITKIDQRILDLKKKLADSILSQLGHSKKYLITKDPVFLEQLVSAEKDFNSDLRQASSVADSAVKRDLLSRLDSLYQDYHDLVHKELDEFRKNPVYTGKGYEQKKEQLTDQILEELAVLESSSQRDISLRMNTLRDAAGSAGTLAIMMLIVAFILVVGVSFVSTRSIANPLTALREKTKDVARGVFGSELTIPSPPELSELTSAFNQMCNKLQRVDAMKSEFFASMSHELRTPLTSIKEGIGLLEDGVGGAMTDKQKRLLTILSEETNRLIVLVNSFLDLSKMEAGMMQYDFRQANLSSLIEKAITEVAPLIEAKKIKVLTRVSEPLPDLRLDRERMLQALRNLIGNAAKFTPEKGQVEIFAESKDEGISFSIKDNGPGIPKENLEVIFEKFQQLPVKASEWVKGTGLGLAFVKHIITAHGGKVWAESDPGGGSTFTFVLPFSPVP